MNPASILALRKDRKSLQNWMVDARISKESIANKSQRDRSGHGIRTLLKSVYCRNMVAGRERGASGLGA